MLNEIKIRESKIEEIREKARGKAENWFQRRSAEKRVLEVYGEATGKEMGGIVRGHLLGDYTGDIWNPANAVHLFFQSTSEVQSLAGGKDLVEEQRLSFLFRLETVNREEVALVIPEEARGELNQLAEKVRWQKWNTPEDVQELLEEKKRITTFIKGKWGRDLLAAYDQLEVAERYNAAHGLLTVKDYFKI